ncbi:MAG: trypsin-like peptidase domain-containing protein, partial [Planctomycetales bacterium]|nr:trypsin-like peptidase domain-containing protein [Planctomycetales bacterium]
TDLAVLKIEADELIPAEWGDSDQLDVGSLVWAVGSPFGLDRSITSGILSAKHRRGIAHSAYQDFLQTDAAVNPGNSGGPLIDSQGKIVGINTAIIGDSFQGISFSLAGNIARDAYEKMKRSGRVPRGWLGVALAEVTEELQAELGLENTQGVYVPSVLGEESIPSPARRAGMQASDVIVRWNGEPIDAPLTLSRQVAATAIGSTVEVIVIRDGKETPLQVVVGERPMELD